MICPTVNSGGLANVISVEPRRFWEMNQETLHGGEIS